MKLIDTITKNLPTLNTLNWLAFTGLSLTTLYTANTAALTKLEPVLGHYRHLAPILALLIGFAVCSFFDLNLRKNFITSVQGLFASDWKQASAGLKTVVIFLVFIVVVRLILSTGATFISGMFMADGMVEDGDTAGLEKMLEEKQRTKQTITLELSGQIQDIRKDANRRADEIVNTAIDAGGAKWASAWRRGNSWYRTVSGSEYAHVVKWRDGIREAERKAEKIKSEAAEQIAQLQTSQTGLIQKESEDANFSSLVAMKGRQIEKAERKEWVLQIGLWAMDFLFTFFAIFTSIGLIVGMKHKPEFQVFRDEAGAFDIMKESVSASWRIVIAKGAQAVGWLDGKADTIVAGVSGGQYVVKTHGRGVSIERRTHSGAPATKGATPATKPATGSATPAPEPTRHPTSSRGETLSDKGDSVSRVIAERVKYVDMKNHIDRISKRYRRAWKKGESEKMRQVVADKNDGVAWLRSLGFDVEVIEKEGKISVKKR